MSPPLKLHRVRLLAAFATIYIVWGSSYLVTRIGVLHLPALLMGGLRYSCAGALMLLVARLMRRRVLPQPGEWRGLVVLAFFGILLTNGISVWAAQYVASNKSALLNATVPCWIVLLGTFGARSHRPEWRQLLGLACGFAGTVLVVQPSGGTHSDLLPQLMILVACLNWAVSTTYMRNVRSRLPPILKQVRGQKVYAQACSFCHGPNATGAEGPDLLRSAIVLHDDKGETIGPFLQKGRPDKGMPAFANMTESQAHDIAEFLHMRVEAAANRFGYKLQNIVTGDPKSGEAYFSSQCKNCHSPTVDLAHIGKTDPADLQTRFLYPDRGNTKVSVTITLPRGRNRERHSKAHR